jgi:hypothetical protein
MAQSKQSRIMVEKRETQKRQIRPQIDNESNSVVTPLKAILVYKTANAMWSSGYPATHMLLSRILGVYKSQQKTVSALICVAAAFEVMEEFL